MLLSELEFASFLAYSVRGQTPEERKSRGVKDRVKNESVVESDNLAMSRYVARSLAQRIAGLPFEDYFKGEVALVPVPRNQLQKAGALWVPSELAMALVEFGLGAEYVPCLRRYTSLAASHLSRASDRPTAQSHYDSLKVERPLKAPRDIVLIDDVITRGATLLGAASLLHQSYPASRIRGFAVLRAVSNPTEFVAVVEPQVGVICLRPDGSTLRRP